MLEFNSYFVSRTYNVNNVIELVISYESQDDKIFHEIKDALPGEAPSLTEVQIAQLQRAEPELISEVWIYIFNGGGYYLMDRYEKDVIATMYIADKDGNIITDEELLKQLAGVAHDATNIDKIDARFNEILDDL